MAVPASPTNGFQESMPSFEDVQEVSEIDMSGTYSPAARQYGDATEETQECGIYIFSIIHMVNYRL